MVSTVQRTDTQYKEVIQQVRGDTITSNVQTKMHTIQQCESHRDKGKGRKRKKTVMI
jgi:hypothetical protein